MIEDRFFLADEKSFNDCSPHASSSKLTYVNPAYYWDAWYSLWLRRMSPECQQTQSRVDLRASLNAQARAGIVCTTNTPMDLRMMVM